MNICKLQQLFRDNLEYDGVVLTDPANIAYLTNVFFPFPEKAPLFRVALVALRSQPPVFVVPALWKQATAEQGVESEICSYDFNGWSVEEAYPVALAEAIQTANLCDSKKIGSDVFNLSFADCTALMEKFPNAVFSDCAEFIANQRMIKTSNEIQILENSANVADRGVIGSLNHAEGTIGGAEYALSEFLERVRVHAVEFKSSGIGHLNLSQGASGRSYTTPITDFKKLEAGNIVRIDFSNNSDGYWSSCGRMLFVGNPSEMDNKDFSDNHALVLFAETQLQPGGKIAEFCKAVCDYALANQINFLPDFGFGHGVGISEVEKPILASDSLDEFETGMVIAVDLFTKAFGGELIHSVETYEITADGCRRISNFKTWDSYYIIDGCRNTH